MADDGVGSTESVIDADAVGAAFSRSAAIGTVDVIAQRRAGVAGVWLLGGHALVVAAGLTWRAT